MPHCTDCDRYYDSDYKFSKHVRQYHETEEYETPEEYMGTPESEQRDFSGEEPDTSEHDPEYETKNERPETKQGELFDYE